VLEIAAQFQFSFPWLCELLVYVLIYATLAASLNLVTGFAGMFSLGHHAFYAVGAYAAGWVTSVWGTVDPGSASGLLCFATSAVASVVAAASAGFLLGFPCLRLRGDYLAVATLAFGELVRIAIQNTPKDVLGGSLGLYVQRVVMDPTGRVPTFRVLFVGIGIAVLAGVILTIRNVIRSAHGRAILSVREDEIAAELLGVRTARYKIRAFVLGAGFAGLAGWLYAHYNGTIAPLEFDLMVGVKILLIVVLGGLGSLTGTIVAAAVLVGAERLLQTGVFGETLKDWMQVEYALVLILLMLLRPDGILGRREVSDLFRRRGKPPAKAAP
jgi:branched-chain amino acid transport system permease protein